MMETQSYVAAHREHSDGFEHHARGGAFVDLVDQPVEVLQLRDIAIRWLRRIGIKTVRELVVTKPNEIGRRCSGARLTALRRAVERCVGCEWSVARTKTLALKPAEPPVPTSALWERLGGLINDADKARSLEDVPGLTARIIHHAERSRIETVGALVAVPYDVLRGSRNVGRLTVERTIATLDAWARLPKAPRVVEAATEERAAPPDWATAGLDALFDAMLARLSPRQRTVVDKYVGVEGPRLMQDAIGQSLGVTESRVSQILRESAQTMAREREGSALLGARLQAALEDGALSPEALVAREPWFAAIRARMWLFVVLLPALPGRRAHLVRFGDAKLLALFTQKTLDDAVQTVSQEFASLRAPVADADVDAIVVRRTRAFGGVIEAAVRSKLGARLRPSVYEHLSPLQIEALLRASPAPIRIDAFARGESGIKWPKTAVMLSGGLVTLVERFEGFDDVARVAIPRCIAWIRAHGPEEIWRCSELTEALAGVALPEWFEPLMLGAMAFRVGGLCRHHHDGLRLPERRPSGRMTHHRRAAISAIPAASP